MIKVHKVPREHVKPPKPNFPAFDVNKLHLEYVEFASKTLPSIGKAELPKIVLDHFADTPPGSPKEKRAKKKKKPAAVEPDEDEGGEEPEDKEDEESDGGSDSDDDESDSDGSSGSEADTGEKGKGVPVPEKPQSPEERVQEYLWRFKILKKSYPDAMLEIPEFNEFSDPDAMKKAYDAIIRELSLDANLAKLQGFLKAGFFGTEFFLCRIVGLDFHGFYKEQIDNFHVYNSLLVELGEKSRYSWGGNLPVEVKLIALVLFNAAMFYIGKLTGAGTGLGSFVSGFFGGPKKPQQAQAHAPAEREERRMKGPQIDVEALKKSAAAERKRPPAAGAAPLRRPAKRAAPLRQVNVAKQINLAKQAGSAKRPAAQQPEASAPEPKGGRSEKSYEPEADSEDE